MVYIICIVVILGFVILFSIKDQFSKLENRVSELESIDDRVDQAASGKFINNKELDKEKTEEKIKKLMDNRIC